MSTGAVLAGLLVESLIGEHLFAASARLVPDVLKQSVAAMQTTVSDWIDHLKIVWIVVGFVFVYVMDVHARGDWPLVSTIDDPVFGFVKSLDADHAVAVAV